MEIELGQKVRDTVTGLEGIAIAKIEWLHGCKRVIIQPKAKKDGTVPDNYTVDEPQLEILEKPKPKKPPKKDEKRVVKGFVSRFRRQPIKKEADFKTYKEKWQELEKKPRKKGRGKKKYVALVTIIIIIIIFVVFGGLEWLRALIPF